ncbi:MAG: TonB-dependent receptor, partial [Ginsengibacter sp.]
PEQVSTWELGYKGTVAKKLYVDINYYNGLSKNFISPTISVPGRVTTANGFKVTPNPAFAGVVVNDNLKNASFLTFFNYGDVRAYGLDVGLNYSFNNFISLAIKYSWFGSDITKDNITNDANKDGYISLEEKSLNAPKNRGVAILSFQNLCKQKMFINIAARSVQQYDFYSGIQIGTAAGKGSRGKIDRPGLPPLLKNFDWGPLGNFTTVDLSAGYKLNKMVGVGMGITNLFDTKQIEFVGSPSIGRLISFEVKVHVPQDKDHLVKPVN